MIRQRIERLRADGHDASHAFAIGDRLRWALSRSSNGLGWAAFCAAYALIVVMIVVHGRFS